MPAVLDAKPKALSFSHPGKQKAYEFLVENPLMDFAAYQIMSGDTTLDEKPFEEVSRAIRVSTDSEFDESSSVPTKINPDIFFAKKESTKKTNKKAKGAPMAKEPTTTAVPKKRGRPPGPKKMIVTVDKPKGKRGRPAKATSKATPAKSPKAKKAAKGIRYTAEKQQEIVTFILSKGRGGLSQAKEKFDISYPTLARWVKVAGSGKGAPKVEKVSKKPGRPKKSEAVPSGHILVSKRVLKQFQKGIANLEKAFGAFSNALKVME